MLVSRVAGIDLAKGIAMKTLKYAVAAALAASALSGTAQAATIVTTGTNATSVMATLESEATGFSIGFSDANLANPFRELLTFTTDAAGMLSIQFGSVRTSDLNDVDFSEAFLTGTGIVGQLAISEILADPNETRALNNILLNQAGTFTLTIRGTPGTQSGSLGGTVAFQNMAAVPEPGTWAMMLLGFGAIGFSMRRRRGKGAYLTQVA
jgi:hypothetical protein